MTTESKTDRIECDPEDIWTEQKDGITYFVQKVGLRKDYYVYRNHAVKLAEQKGPELGQGIVTLRRETYFNEDGEYYE